jgi:hypothetical protein
MLFECDDGNQVVLAFSTILQCTLFCMASSFINLKEKGFFFGDVAKVAMIHKIIYPNLARY